jgi:hypothetical protein
MRQAAIKITCPCCGSLLTVDPELRRVIAQETPAHPAKTRALHEANQWLEAQAQRREEDFRRSAEAEKDKSELLERKFEEALNRVKDQAESPPPREIDLD